MKNKGINNNAYYFSEKLDGHVEVILNLNKHENFNIIKTSIFKTNSLNPIELVYIQNNLGLYSNDDLGCACRLSYYNKIEYSRDENNINCIKISQADTNEYIYYKDLSFESTLYYRYLSFNTTNYLLVDKNNSNIIDLYDIENNKFSYNLNVSEVYPICIKLNKSLSSTENDYTFTYKEGNLWKISNCVGDEVEITYNSDNYINLIKVNRHIENENTYVNTHRIENTYNSSELSKVKLISLKNNDGTYSNSYEYNYSWNSNKTIRIISDSYMGKRIEYGFNKLRKYLYSGDVNYKEYTFSKYDNYTTVTNNYDSNIRYYFYKYDLSKIYSCDAYLNTMYEELNEKNQITYASSNVANSKSYVSANKKNIILNSYFENTTAWVFSSETCYQFITVNQENVFASFLGDKYIKLIGGNETYITQNISINEPIRERYILNLWVFQNDYNYANEIDNLNIKVLTCEVNLKKEDEIIKTYNLDFYINDLYNICYKNMGIDIDDSYDNIDIKLKLESDYNICIKAITLYKDRSNVSLYYNQDDRLVDVSSNTNLIYNSDNKIIEEIDSNYYSTFIERDNYGNENKIITNGIVNEKTFNSKRNVLTEKISDEFGNRIEKSIDYYELEDNVYDEIFVRGINETNGISSEYIVDFIYNNITKVETGDKIKDYFYEHPFSALTKIQATHNSVDNILYEYYNEICAYNGRIKYIILENGITYKYEYNVYGDLYKVCVGNSKENCDTIVCAFEYEIKSNVYTSNIHKVYFGAIGSSDYISYTYDNFSRLSAMVFGELYNFTFEYDSSNNNLISVTNHSKYQTTFVYNNENLISKLKYFEINDTNYNLVYSIDYFYDNRKSITHKEISYNNYDLVYAYNDMNRSLKTKTDIYNKIMYSNKVTSISEEQNISKTYVCDFIENGYLKNKLINEKSQLIENIIYPDYCNINNISSDGEIRQYLINSSDDVYLVNFNNDSSTIENYYFNRASLAFYFKLGCINRNKYLCYFGNDQTTSIGIKVFENMLILQVIQYESLIHEEVIFENFSINSWNFFMFEMSITDNKIIIKIHSNHNVYNKVLNINNISIDKIFLIGSCLNNGFVNTSSFLNQTYISSLIYSEKMISSEDLYEIKDCLDASIYNHNYIDNDSSLPFLRNYNSSTRFIKRDGIGNYEYFPLEDSLFSLKGNYAFEYSKKEYFVYSNDRKRKVLKKNKYDIISFKPNISITNNYCFSFKVNIKENYGSNYIYYLKQSDSSNNYLALKFNSDDNSYSFEINGVSHNIYNLGSGWIEVSLFLKKVDGIIKCFLPVTDEMFIYDLQSSDFSLNNNILLYIGSPLIESNPFLEVENLIISDSVYQDYYFLDTFYKRERRMDSFDSLGFLYTKELALNEQVILKNKYSYENNNGIRMPLVSSELISYRSSSNLFNYTYNNDNYLTSILKDNNLVASYQYNIRGFLTNENIKNSYEVNYEYDRNGNILKKKKVDLSNDETIKEDLFTYDSIYKDRLVSYNNISFNYNSDKPLFISSVTKDNIVYNFIYKNNILSEINWGDNTNIKYEYNESFQRIKKYINNQLVKKYYYENDLLIKEEGINNTLYFLYDHSNMLYGFILNNTSTYYYVRDVMGNIIGIANSIGNSVVKYEYDAFGNILNIEQGNSNIGDINPFRYKGYYYDEETQLFNCYSRYYSPELCRFISPDSIEYLDPQSINGLNLYCYCKNNPISYTDPSGHFVLSSFLIAVGIGAVAGFLGSYIPDVYEKIKKDGFQFSDLNTFAENGREYLFNTFIGALTGAAGGMGLSLFFSAPLVGAINTYAAYMTGQISTFGEDLGYFALSTTISFFTLGIQKAASAYKTPVKVRGLNNTVNKLVYGIEKTLYWIGESVDFSVGLTVSISTGLRGL